MVLINCLCILNVETIETLFLYSIVFVKNIIIYIMNSIKLLRMAVTEKEKRKCQNGINFVWSRKFVCVLKCYCNFELLRLVDCFVAILTAMYFDLNN